MNEKRTRAALVLAVTMLFAVLLAAYVGSYYALVIPSEGSGFSGGGWVKWSMVPDYRLIGHYGDELFSPIHEIDRKVRPQTWADHEGPSFYMDPQDQTE